MTLTAERLREALDYNPSTGVFTWKVQSGRCRVGDAAGWFNPTSGYQEIQLDNKRSGAHRFAWFYVNGVWPDDQVDHIDENKLNNRIDNLRCATNVQNNQNCSKPLPNNSSGYRGVSCDKRRGGWNAFISHDGCSINLGRFDTPEEASEAYLAAKAVLHPFWVAK